MYKERLPLYNEKPLGTKSSSSLYLYCLGRNALYLYCSGRNALKRTLGGAYCNGPNPLLAHIVLFGLPLKVFKTRLLGRSFHTLTKNASFSFSTDVGSHSSPSFGAQCPRWHSFPSPIDVRPPIRPLSRLSVLAGTPLRIHPFRGSASSLAHHPTNGIRARHQAVCQQGH